MEWTCTDQSQQFNDDISIHNEESSINRNPSNTLQNTPTIVPSQETNHESSITNTTRTQNINVRRGRRGTSRSSSGSGARFTDSEAVVVSQILRKYKTFNAFKYNNTIPKRSKENYKRNLKDRFNSFLNQLQEKSRYLGTGDTVLLMMDQKLVAKGLLKWLGKDRTPNNLINSLNHNETVDCVSILDVVGESFQKSIVYPSSQSHTTLGSNINKDVAWPSDQILPRVDIESELSNEMFQLYQNKNLLSMSTSSVSENIDVEEVIQENQESMRQENPYLKSLLENQYISKQLAQKYLSFSLTQKSYLGLMGQYSSMLNSASEIIEKIKDSNEIGEKTVYFVVSKKYYKRKVMSYRDIMRKVKELTEQNEDLISDEIYYIENGNEIAIESAEDFELISNYTSIFVKELE